MSAVRFFTSAALRSREEVDGEIVQWLPRSITVEYIEQRPLTGVWRSHHGECRVCWYRSEDTTADIGALHRERHGDEPYWVITRRNDDDSHLVVAEYDGSGALIRRRHWEFDPAGMPLLEELHGPEGDLRLRRRYECFKSGTVIDIFQETPPEFTSVELPCAPATSHPFPIPELAGEPYPCGGHLGEARILSLINSNEFQVRGYAAYRVGERWMRGLASMVTMKVHLSDQQRRVIEFDDEGVARLIEYAVFDDPRQRGFRFRGCVEELPDGATLEELVAGGPLTRDVAVDVVRQVGEVARRAQRRGHALGGIRPELVYVRRVGTRLVLAGVAHRAAVLREATYSGEAIRWPPMFHADFHSLDDVTALAQLLWHLTSGGHPFLAPGDLRWNESWNEFRHQRWRPQPWTGPAELGPLLTRVLFESKEPPPLEAFLDQLATVA